MLTLIKSLPTLRVRTMFALDRDLGSSVNPPLARSSWTCLTGCDLRRAGAGLTSDPVLGTFEANRGMGHPGVVASLPVHC